MSRETERRPLSGVEPRGQLRGTLGDYEAPASVQKRMARMAGAVIGTAVLPHNRLVEIIQTSMTGDGVPKWDQVTTKVHEEVNGGYRKLKR